MSVTGSIIAGVGLAGSIGGAAISSNAAGNAASTQAQAANNAALIQQADANASIQQQEQALNLAQQNSAPYREVGQNALLAQNDLMGLTPVAPTPVNSGGNIAPQAAGLAGGGSPGALAPAQQNPITTPQPPPYPGAPTPRAAGGPVANRLARHYIVGEKGPEELTMFPNGTGWVTPNKSTNRLIPRAAGGAVQGPAEIQPQGPVLPSPGGSGNGNGQGGPEVGTAGPGPQAGPRAHTGQLANPIPQGPYTPPGPYGAQSNNPLVTGGSPQPVQNTPFTQWTQQFQAPTAAQAGQYPGYQFQLQQGEQALANQASASGELGDSNYGRGLVNYAENAAQSDYSNVYNQAQQQYAQNYNIFNNNQNTQFNRLASLSGTGQTSTAQLNNTNQQGASNIGNTLLQSGAQIGQQLNNAGAATASGYIGQGNAWAGAAGNAANAATMPLYLQYLNQQGQVDLSGIPTGGVSTGPYYGQ